MPTTPKGLPYPSNSDNVDIPGDMQALAEAVDTALDNSVGGVGKSTLFLLMGA